MPIPKIDPSKESKLKKPASVSNVLRHDFPVQSTGLKRKTATAVSAVSKLAKTKPTSTASSTRATTASTARTAASSLSASRPKENTSAAANAKKKRPAWDTKGRLQDMEEEQGSMRKEMNSAKSTLEQKTAEISELLNLKTYLETHLSSKNEESTGKDAVITGLKSQLILKEKELLEVNQTSAGREKDLQRMLSKSTDEAELLEAKLKTSQMECEAMKATLATQSASILDLEARVKNIQIRLDSSEQSSTEKSVKIEQLEKDLEGALQTIDSLESQLRDEEMVRRQLHNTIQELKGNIRVFCRVRPSKDSADQLPHLDFPDKDSKEIVLKTNSESADGMKYVEKKYEFSFDKVFNPASSQADVFHEISQLVQSALDGYNVCIFAYGQTGSGKTFTMEGPSGNFEDKDAMGMIPRAVEQIWEQTEKLKEKGWKYEMEGSYIEIYNESLRDLLDVTKSSGKKMEIRHALDGKTSVTDATVVRLLSAHQVMDVLKTAASNRQVAGTECNERSSRSHSVFMLTLSGKNDLTGEESFGMLNLVDLGITITIQHLTLAGSERLSQSKSTGDRLKETQAINKSLSCLGDVIAALGMIRACVYL